MSLLFQFHYRFVALMFALAASVAACDRADEAVVDIFNARINGVELAPYLVKRHRSITDAKADQRALAASLARVFGTTGGGSDPRRISWDNGVTVSIGITADKRGTADVLSVTVKMDDFRGRFIPALSLKLSEAEFKRQFSNNSAYKIGTGTASGRMYYATIYFVKRINSRTSASFYFLQTPPKGKFDKLTLQGS